MNGEVDALKNLTKGKENVNLHRNGEEFHKNGAEIKKSSSKNGEGFEQTPIWIAVMTYIAYAILILFGYVRDFMRFYGLEKSRAFKERGNKVSNVMLFVPGCCECQQTVITCIKSELC